MFFNRKPNIETESVEQAMVKDSRFNINMPPEWLDHSVYMIEGPEDDGIKHCITIKVETEIENNDIGDVAGKRIGELASSLDGFDKISLAQVKLQQSFPAYEIIFKWLPTENREVVQHMMFVLAKNLVYTLTTTFSQKTYKQLGKQIDEIYKSFTVPDTQGENYP